MTIIEIRLILDDMLRRSNLEYIQNVSVIRLSGILQMIPYAHDEEGTNFVVNDLVARLGNNDLGTDDFFAYLLGIWHFASGAIRHDRLIELYQGTFIQDLHAFLQRTDNSINVIPLENAQRQLRRETSYLYDDLINSIGEHGNPNNIIHQLIMLFDRVEAYLGSLIDNELDLHENIVTDDEDNDEDNDEEDSYIVNTMLAAEYDHNIEDIFSSMYLKTTLHPIISSGVSMEQITLIPADVIDQLSIIIGAVYSLFIENSEIDG